VGLGLGLKQLQVQESVTKQIKTQIGNYMSTHHITNQTKTTKQQTNFRRKKFKKKMSVSSILHQRGMLCIYSYSPKYSLNDTMSNRAKSPIRLVDIHSPCVFFFPFVQLKYHGTSVFYNDLIGENARALW